MTSLSTIPTLIDGTLRLRAPVTADAQARFDLGRVPAIEHMFGIDPDTVKPMTMNEATKWVNWHVEATDSWFIDVDEQFIGVVFLHSINKLDQRATLGISIFDEARLGQGFGTRAMRLMLRHAFTDMCLHRVGLRTIEYNHRAIAAYKKLGFAEEGRERESGFVGGQRYDDVMMGLLKHNFLALRGAA